MGYQNGNAPTFTPPSQAAPNFTPPSDHAHGNNVCFYHPTEHAVTQCARCGKHVCQDCAEAYGVNGGEFAGRNLCYDCCRELVAQDAAELTKNKDKIKFQFILLIIGMVLGFGFGFYAGIKEGPGHFVESIFSGLVFACVGGVFLTAVKMWFNMVITFFSNLDNDNFIIGCIILAFQSVFIILKCIYSTVSKTIYYVKYLKQTSGLIEDDYAALRQMEDYMQYTLVRNQNKNVDLEALMKEGSELYNNSYARAVHNNGEEAADNMLRRATTIIAENGEIIRNFEDAA